MNGSKDFFELLDAIPISLQDRTLIKTTPALTLSASVPEKTKMVRLCEIVQSGAIAGLAAIPLVADMGRFRASPRLVVAATILAPLALGASFWLHRSSARERGLWGAILTIALYLWALSIPAIA